MRSRRKGCQPRYERSSNAFFTFADADRLRASRFGSHACLYELSARSFVYFASYGRYAAGTASIQPLPELLRTSFVVRSPTRVGEPEPQPPETCMVIRERAD